MRPCWPLPCRSRWLDARGAASTVRPAPRCLRWRRTSGRYRPRGCCTGSTPRCNGPRPRRDHPGARRPAAWRPPRHPVSLVQPPAAPAPLKPASQRPSAALSLIDSRGRHRSVPPIGGGRAQRHDPFLGQLKQMCLDRERRQAGAAGDPPPNTPSRRRHPPWPRRCPRRRSPGAPAPSGGPDSWR